MTIVAFIAIIALSLALAFLSRRGHAEGDARDFFVASGQFGAILFFFLAVGETYSITTMLGFPGGVYAGGDDFIIWFFGYVLLAAPAVYFFGPMIRDAGAFYGAATIPDFFRRHFDSRLLEVVMAVFCIVLLVPVGTTQFVGLRLVLSALELPISATLLTAIAGILAFLYVVIAGLRASAFVAILKDVLMMAAILIVGAAALIHWQAPAVATIAQTATVPALKGSGPTNGLTFAISTVLLQSLGFIMIPQTWSFILSARSGETIRRAQAVAPLYLVMYPILMLVAYFARSHGIVPLRQDFVFIAVAMKLLPTWLVGVILAAITLAGLVMLSAVCLAISPLVTRNLASGLTGDAQRRWSALVTAIYLALSLIGMATSSSLIVTLTNVFYFGISQTLPALAAAFLFPRVRAGAILAGMFIGCSIALWVYAAAVPVHGLNPGAIGLLANAMAVALVTMVAPRRNAQTVFAKLNTAASNPS